MRRFLINMARIALIVVLFLLAMASLSGVFVGVGMTIFDAQPVGLLVALVCLVVFCACIERLTRGRFY